MKQHRFSRTELLVGTDNMEKLKNAKVCVLGVGGVGSYCAEALARSNVGTIVLVDDDDVCLTNINRQVHATTKTIGTKKTLAMKERLLDINPKLEVICHDTFLGTDNIGDVIDLDTTFVVDAIDTVTAKIATVLFCQENNIDLIMCLGTGNKFDPLQFQITDIYKTSVCPLAKVMRHELRKRNVKKQTVLFSTEKPVKPKTNDVISCKEGCVCTGDNKKCTIRRQIPGSMSFVPPVAGFSLASHVINSIIELD